MKKLNRTTVPKVPRRPVKIIQFGEGNFLRAFVDWMVDVLNKQTDFNGNIQIVQPLERGMDKIINSQNGLYHVLLEGIEQGQKVQKTRLITSVEGVLNPYEDYQGFLKLGENPNLELNDQSNELIYLYLLSNKIDGANICFTYLLFQYFHQLKIEVQFLFSNLSRF